MKQIATILMTVVCGAILLGFAGWVSWGFLKRSDDPTRLVVKWILTVLIFVALSALSGGIGVSPILPPLAAVFGILLAILWGRNLGELVAKPFTSMYDGGQADAEPVPFYSIAEARRKRGEFPEAIAEVTKQLERFPNDFQGWMLLAEIHAENQHDIVSAMEAIEQVLARPDQAQKNIAFAMNRVADWQLKLRKDPAAAIRALERIVELLPETEQAQVTLQRIAQITNAPLPRTDSEPARLAVPRAERRLGLITPTSAASETEEEKDPARLVAACVQRLQEMPEDNMAREKLAILYAEHHQRLDLAELELEQMITAANQPARQVVHWLNLKADLQLKFASDVALPRESLQRIIDLYPGTAHAENATHRIAYLGLDVRGKEKSQVIKLGSYEKNLGLK